MEGEFGGFTVHGGWLIFLALVALWIALAIEARSRRLSSLLEAAIKETKQLRTTDADPAGGLMRRPPGEDLEQLAAAVEVESKGAEAGHSGTREPQPAGSGEV